MKSLILASFLLSMNLFANDFGKAFNAYMASRAKDTSIIKDYGICIPFVKNDFERVLNVIENKYKSLKSSYTKFRCNGNKTLLHLYLLNPVKAKSAGENLEAYFFANENAKDALLRRTIFVASLLDKVENLTAIERINGLINDSNTSDEDRDELAIIKQRYCDYLDHSVETCPEY